MSIVLDERPTAARRRTSEDIEFGPTLRELREKAGMSQSKLSELADFDHSYVSRLEAGARFPTWHAVDRISKALGLSSHDANRLFGSARFLNKGQVAYDFGDLPDLKRICDLAVSGVLNQRALRRLQIAMDILYEAFDPSPVSEHDGQIR
jgi:transcriptional regulator with XRE-family HTH domain